ncbi:hypothetical protein [Pseudoduganella umbonata]|uniref:Uncharacterized protein n=1 Tax=Pseudoduganella umbonata TaxID=864828 RepID=A0A4V1EDW6_9BURK|nr:hypothetical protein [Pseudoduganella umbonata]MBB3222288.1 hypothetical protein [Pseudoduganella umbonata]QCP12511.1 hypothetical protein FCL38_20325 [Pseudoduganella umbonata]
MSITAWDCLVTAALAGLLLATLAHNIGLHGRPLARLEALALVPKWKFFAPNPGTFNLYLLYRDRCADGSLTPWLILHAMDHDRDWYTFIWNPDRRLRKALHDLITSLPYPLNETDPQLFKLTTAYLLIISHLAALPRIADSRETQFLVMKKYLDEPCQVLFCSELHRL